jgi:eukaryotic-like serine/threonine-protein kinase
VNAQPPRLLKNRYVVGDVIGQGGMAAVHRAHDSSLGRDVAIKLFPPTADEAVLSRSEDEVNVLATLSHHSLVTLLDAGVDRSTPGENRIFLVMELVTGSDLQRKIATHPLNSRQIGQIGHDLAEALQYIHHRGVVHRDVKPSNVLFVDYSDDSTRARVKLTDFGIAHRGVEKASPETVTTGTAAYLSPEQVRRDEVGPPTDVYSLGLVLLECFTGVIAFPGDPTESAMARLARDPFIPRGLADGWRSLLRAMTARDPADRPTAGELVLAIRALVINEMGRHVSEADETIAVTAQEPSAFDNITSLAATVLGAPIAIMAVSPSGYEWFRTTHGIDLAEIERKAGRQGSALLYKDRWNPMDTGSDPSVLADPAVAAQFGMKYHVSTPVLARDGQHLAVLCVMDVDERQESTADLDALAHLAAVAVLELERRLEGYLLRRDADQLSNV